MQSHAFSLSRSAYSGNISCYLRLHQWGTAWNYEMHFQQRWCSWLQTAVVYQPHYLFDLLELPLVQVIIPFVHAKFHIANCYRKFVFHYVIASIFPVAGVTLKWILVNVPTCCLYVVSRMQYKIWELQILYVVFSPPPRSCASYYLLIYFEYPVIECPEVLLITQILFIFFFNLFKAQQRKRVTLLCLANQ